MKEKSNKKISIIEDGLEETGTFVPRSMYKNVTSQRLLFLVLSISTIAHQEHSLYAVKSKTNVIKIMFFRYKYITLVGNLLSPIAKNCSGPQPPFL
jgi:hypothetical protein